MKNLLLFCLICISITFSFAQNDSIIVEEIDSLTETFEEQIEHLYEFVDFTDATTGMVIEKGFPIAPYQLNLICSC